jgi:hypothetical protein
MLLIKRWTNRSFKFLQGHRRKIAIECCSRRVHLRSLRQTLCIDRRWKWTVALVNCLSPLLSPLLPFVAALLYFWIFGQIWIRLLCWGSL